MTKVKTVIKLYTNRDSTMELVRQFDEKCEGNGRRSIVKDAKKYAEEMDLELSLSPGAVVTTTGSNKDISSEKVGKAMQYSMNAKRMDTIKDQKLIHPTQECVCCDDDLYVCSGIVNLCDPKWRTKVREDILVQNDQDPEIQEETGTKSATCG